MSSAMKTDVNYIIYFMAMANGKATLSLPTETVSSPNSYSKSSLVLANSLNDNNLLGVHCPMFF